MDREPGVLVRVLSALGSYDDLVPARWGPSVDNAVLEYHRGVSKDEIGRAGDLGFGVELALGVDAEGVLVSFEAAPVEDRAVGPR